MPTKRMTTTFAAPGATTFAKGGASSFKAASTKVTVLSAISDNAGSYFVNVNGMTVRAKASIDAPIQVGDSVYVQQGAGGEYLISGVA